MSSAPRTLPIADAANLASKLARERILRAHYHRIARRGNNLPPEKLAQANRRLAKRLIAALRRGDFGRVNGIIVEQTAVLYALADRN